MKKLLGLGVIVGAACGGAGEPARVTAAVDTVDGVEHWAYPAEPAGALAWTADTVGVLGDAFAEDAYQFNEVSWEALAGDAAGHLYVLDRQGSRVLEYGPDLRHRATYGRSGEGPGELSQPIGLALGAGDTIWVSDFSNGRLTGYPRSGGDPRTVAYPDNGGMPAPTFAAIEDGFIQAFRPMPAFTRGGPGAAGNAGEDEPAQSLPLVRLNGSLEPVDTLWTMPEPPTDMVRLEMGQRMMILMMAREFAPALQWQPLSDGAVVVSDTAAYLLRVISGDGTLQRVIERAPAPRAVTEADREQVRQRLRDEEAEGGTSIRIGGSGPDDATRQRMLEERLEKMTFAAVLPRVLALRVDPRDRIWVGVAGETPDSIGRIDIYEPDGTLIGELHGVPMPDVFVGEDRIGVLRRDELDVQQVVLLEVTGQRPPS